MPPNTTVTSTLLVTEVEEVTPAKVSSPPVRSEFIPGEDKSYRTLWGTFLTPLKWINITFFAYIHYLAILRLATFPYIQKFDLVLWSFFVGIIAGFGVTGGAHRYWTHKSYKAKMPLRIFLAVCYAMAGQNKLFNWVRDHRVHHKFSETHADPHNANRGFFFAHMGWLMMIKHPDVVSKGRQVDCTDLYEDPVFRFHDKYFWVLKAIFCFGLPTLIPWFFWNQDLYYSFMSAGFVRFVVNLHCTWSVNSAAHIFGNKPYNKHIQPVENLAVSIAALGEGWHNYHHTFPWDYKAAELGNYRVNFTTCLLDLFAKIGWAYDLKQPSAELVRKVIENSGDGTHESVHHHHEEVPAPENDKSK